MNGENGNNGNNGNEQEMLGHIGRQGTKISSESLRKIKEAARLRLERTSWEQVSVRLRYASAESARSFLTQRYPVVWQSEYEKAKKLFLNSIESEAIHSQRELLRIDELMSARAERYPDLDGTLSTKDRLDIKQRAAHSLLAHSAKLQSKSGDVNVSLHNEVTASDQFDQFRKQILEELYAEEDVEDADRITFDGEE